MLQSIPFAVSAVVNNPYIPWDVDLFKQGVSILRNGVGIIFNVSLWGFLGITLIFLVLKIANSVIH